ncbi:MAG: TerB family tellurite resistance protein [Planctomycetota bacterium]
MSKSDVDLLKAAACIAGLDGEITPHEAQALRHLARRAGVREDHLETLMEKARTDDDLLNEQLSVVRSDPETTLAVLYQVAAIDGVVSGDERVVVEHFGVMLGLSRERIDKIFSVVEKRLAAKEGTQGFEE